MTAVARVLCLPLLLLVVLAACASEQDPPLRGTDPATGRGEPPELAGRTYVVTEALVAGTERPLVSEVRLAFEADEVVVTTGCNSIRGSWEYDGPAVRFDSLMQTEMGCEPELAEQEQWLAELLGAPMTAQPAGDELVLAFGGTELHVVDREQHSPDLTLTGQRWELDTIVAGDSASSVPVGAKAWLEFAEDGRVTGLLGCNRGSGTWTEEDGVLRMSLASTKMACQGPRGEVETAMLAVLNAPIEVRITERRLDLTAAKAGLGFTASRQD